MPSWRECIPRPKHNDRNVASGCAMNAVSCALSDTQFGAGQQTVRSKSRRSASCRSGAKIMTSRQYFCEWMGWCRYAGIGTQQNRLNSICSLHPCRPPAPERIWNNVDANGESRKDSSGARNARSGAQAPQAMNTFRWQLLRTAQPALLPTPPMLYGSPQRTGSPSSRLDAHEN